MKIVNYRTRVSSFVIYNWAMKIVPYKTWVTKLYLTKPKFFFENCTIQKLPFFFENCTLQNLHTFCRFCRVQFSKRDFDRYSGADFWECLSGEISKHQFNTDCGLQRALLQKRRIVLSILYYNDKTIKTSAHYWLWLAKYFRQRATNYKALLRKMTYKDIRVEQ